MIRKHTSNTEERDLAIEDFGKAVEKKPKRKKKASEKTKPTLLTLDRKTIKVLNQMSLLSFGFRSSKSEMARLAIQELRKLDNQQIIEKLREYRNITEDFDDE